MRTLFLALTMCFAISMQAQDIREKYDSNSFAYFVQHFPKKKSKVVRAWNGTVLSNTSLGVFDIDVPQYQQCADAVIRLHAEWLFSQKRYRDIHYNFTNGFKCDFIHWAEGYRINVNGNKTSWYRSAKRDYSYKNFKKYLEQVFYYAGTISLSKELRECNHMPDVGDVFVISGEHAVIIIDKIYHNNIPYYLFAQSWIPAQNIEIVSGYNKRIPNYKRYVTFGCDDWIVISGYSFNPHLHLKTWHNRN